jgi:hypothetical protein
MQRVRQGSGCYSVVPTRVRLEPVSEDPAACWKRAARGTSNLSVRYGSRLPSREDRESDAARATGKRPSMPAKMGLRVAAAGETLLVEVA